MFASHLVMAGVDLTTVKELLGHKSITMTMRYTHLSQDHKVKAVEVLGSLHDNYMTAYQEKP
jgi:site-specific recombinase XerD